MYPKRPCRSLIAVLCLSLAVPPIAMAQASKVASAMAQNAQTGTLAADALRATPQDGDHNLPGNVAEGVFGVYGGRESRFTNKPGTMSGLRSPLSSVELPDLGDGSGGKLTPQAERRVGEQMMRDVRADPDYLDDWLIRDYLDSISAKLSAAAATQYLGGYRPDFDLFAVRDPQINAFSMPGGFIGVNTGLIAATQTESELASVIGHEMGHVLQRHIARMLSTQEKSSYTALASMLAGLLAGVLAHSGDLGMGIAMGGQAFAVDNQLRFSRAAEHEADRVGFQMLAAAGYDPYGMSAFFERLDRSTMADNGVPAYVRTHPLTSERIADMEDRARRVPYRQPRQSAEYGFVRARSRVLQVSFASDYREVASRLKSEIVDQTALNPAANWYGVALAQMQIGDYDAANDALAKARKLFEGDEAQEAAVAALLKQQPKTASVAGKPGIVLPPVQVHAPTASKTTPRSSPSLDVLAADIARKSGHLDEAIRLSELAEQRWPESHAALDANLQALLAARRFKDAQVLARRETRAEPNRGEWWLYLAQASAGLNDPLTQHQAMAEKLALDGAWPSAIRQLKEARDVKTASFYELSTISARLRDFETRYKEERELEKS
jgi:beta-barrel assembly-enhancing protease